MTQVTISPPPKPKNGHDPKWGDDSRVSDPPIPGVRQIGWSHYAESIMNGLGSHQPVFCHHVS